MRRGQTALKPAARLRAQATSLNRPTGPRRTLLAVDAPLSAVAAAGDASGATVNDLVLAAVVGALAGLLDRRGERVEELVLSVPFASHRSGQLGNASAVLPLRLPALPDPLERLGAIAAITTVAKRSERGASNALLGPAFRILVHTGLFRRFIDHQRMIHTFVTNMRGPDHPLALGGHIVERIVPIGVATGNVTASFAVLSYAGRLTIAIVADPEAVPDAPVLAQLLEEERSRLTGTAVQRGPDRIGNRTADERTTAPAP